MKVNVKIMTVVGGGVKGQLLLFRISLSNHCKTACPLAPPPPPPPDDLA